MRILEGPAAARYVRKLERRGQQWTHSSRKCDASSKT